MPPTYRPNGLSKHDRARLYERDRGTAGARLYGHAWSKAAKAHIRSNPFCLYCRLEDRVTAAELVDHLYPHRQDAALFWRRELWVSSCADCHNGMKQSTERQGFAAIQALARRLGYPILPTPTGGA